MSPLDRSGGAPSPMPTAPHTSICWVLGTLLGGMLLLRGGVGLSVPRVAAPPASLHQSGPPVVMPQGLGVPFSPAGVSTPEGQSASGGSRPSTPRDTGNLEASDILVGILLIVLGGLAVVAPFIVLAVSLVMEGGCLRSLVFAAGWAFSFFGGGIVSGLLGVVATEALGLGSGLLENVLPVGIVILLLAYPIAAWWGRRWFRSLPREQYIVWKQALTGGALLGFGVGSIANLLRSAIPVSGGSGGFGGFGGGSFGGGGAGGSWSASAGGASTSGAATSAGASATGAPAGASSGTTAPAVVSGTAPVTSSSAGGWGSLLPTWLRRFRWIHGVLFALALFSFAVLGAWNVEYPWRDTGLLVLVLGIGGAYGIYTLWRWWAPSASPFPDREFQGGEAAASWS